MSVSNCSSSRGNTQRGDQTGTEYYVCDWYKHSSGWDYYLIYEGERADEVNALASQYARAAALNDHIGYSQPDRYSMWDRLKTSDYNPANITIDCNADCSSSTTFIFKAIGYKLGIEALKNLDIYLYTGSMKNAFVNAGFKAYSESKYLTSPDYIKAGGVLLNVKYHVVINLDDGSKSGGSTPVSTGKYSRNDVKPYENSKSAQELQAILSVLGFYDEALGIDGIYGTGTFNAICDFQSKYNLGADGYASVNGITFAKADELMSGKHATIEPNFTGKAVQDMQSAMNLFGFRDQSGNFLTENGNYDDKTLYAIMQFQDAFGLGADGKASATGVTWRKVDELYNGIHDVTVTTKGDSLNVRKGRGTSYGIVTTIPNGSTHKATCSVDGWTYLHDVNGWVSSAYLI